MARRRRCRHDRRRTDPEEYEAAAALLEAACPARPGDALEVVMAYCRWSDFFAHDSMTSPRLDFFAHDCRRDGVPVDATRRGRRHRLAKLPNLSLFLLT